MPTLSRRLLIASGAAFAFAGAARAQTRGSRALAVYKSPTCGCCDGWVTHMRQAGFTVAVHVVEDPGTVRRARGLPDTLASCHTGVIGGYAIEGHVPAADDPGVAGGQRVGQSPAWRRRAAASSRSTPCWCCARGRPGCSPAITAPDPSHPILNTGARMSRSLCVLAVSALLLSAGAAAAHDSAPPPQVQGTVQAGAAEAAAVVDAFHAALKAGNTDGALAMLAANVMIFEEGGAERSREEYASHHLAADAAFAAAVEATPARRSGWAAGDVAWIASEGRTTGTFNGRAVDRLSAETMVLKRGPEGWRIHHIHWSSRAPRPAG